MKRYQMLIVDDDVFFRKYLNKIISRNYNEIDVCEFPSAKHALNYLTRNSADFILTDISMPQMTGVEFIQCLKESGYKMPCAVLSSYDDFSYVRETLRLGAVDYLLKHDTQESDICRVIQSCIDICALNKQKKVPFIEDGHRLVVGMQSRKYIEGKINKQDYIESLKRSYLGMCYNKNFFIVCRDYKIEMSSATILSENKSDIEYEYTYYENTQGKYIYIVWIINTQEISEINEFVTLFLYSVLCCSDSEQLGVSGVSYKIDMLQQCFEQAVDAQHQAFVHQRKQILHQYISYDRIEHITKQVIQMEDKFSEIRTLDKEKTLKDVEEIMSLLYQGYYRMEDWAKTIRRILNYFIKRLYNENFVLEESGIHDVKDIYQLLNKEKVLKWLESFFVYYNSKKKEQSYTELTIKVMEYIDKNVMQYIAIKNIANELQYSENYISKQFKIDTGLRIKEYVNICKIERAKEMLLSNRYKVYEIADKLQYNTDAYFCVVFKSVTGMTVTEYINDVSG